MKHHIDVPQRRPNGRPVPHVPLKELHTIRHPCGPAETMRLRLEIIQHAYRPALPQQSIRNVRSDEIGAAGHKRAPAESGVTSHSRPPLHTTPPARPSGRDPPTPESKALPQGGAPENGVPAARPPGKAQTARTGRHQRRASRLAGQKT